MIILQLMDWLSMCQVSIPIWSTKIEVEQMGEGGLGMAA